MRIDSLKLKDFRNYEALTLTPHPGVNLLFGQNGSGKTNLLEAVHYCALGRSHRTSQDREVVRKGAMASAVGVTVVKESGRHDVALKLTPAESRKKQAFLDRKRAPRLSDMMGQLQCVIFSPEDLMLVKEGPSVRRRFLDMMLSQLYTPYFVALQQYQKALEQRNALLREARRGRPADPDMLDAFERAMAIPCETIVRHRRQATAQLAVIAREKYAAISGRANENFQMEYQCCLQSDEDIPGQVMAILRRSRTDDGLRGVTSFGIHREDVTLSLSGREMKQFASQGQIRTAALSMKLAQLELFRRVTGESPVLLLDDVMSELDMTRRTRLLDEISGVQTFVTCTDESDLEGCRERRSYQVSLTIDGSAQVREETPGEHVAPYELEDPDFT